MTRQRNDNHSTEFGLWLRKQPSISSRNFDAENLDYIWFAYKEGWLILIEEKRYFNPSRQVQSTAQQDTHGIIDQALKLSSGKLFDTMRGKRSIEYRGYFLVCFEKTNPEDSKFIMINGKKYNKMSLLVLLATGRLINISDEDIVLPYAIIQLKYSLI